MELVAQTLLEDVIARTVSRMVARGASLGQDSGWIPPPAQTTLTYDDVGLVIDAIKSNPKLAALQSLWQVGPEGFDAKPIGLEWVAYSLIVRTLGLNDPKQVVSELLDLISANTSRYRLVALLTGIKVEDAFDLDPNLRLMPADQLSLNRSPGLESIRLGEFERSTSAALVEVIPYSPVFLDRGELPARAYPSGRAKRIRQIAGVVALACQCCVAVKCVFIEGDDERLPANRQAVVIGNPPWTSRANPLMTGVANPDNVRAIMREYTAFKADRGALDIAIERLNRARGNAAFEDQAMDLGLAVEVILMHEPEENAELRRPKGITKLLMKRAKFLIGGSPECSGNIGEWVEFVFNLRSTAIHRGRLPAKIETPMSKRDGKTVEPYLALVQAEDLVACLIGAILSRGSWPNWNEIETAAR